MKKYISILLALAMVLALTACGAGATESSASVSTSADVSTSAEVIKNESHEYTAADLEGVVTLDGFGVIQGSMDIDLLAAVDYDNTVVTNMSMAADGVSYELAKAQAVTYIITVNKAALDERLGLPIQEGGADEEVVIEAAVLVPVVAPTNCERFLALNPDMVLLTDGNKPYTSDAGNTGGEAAPADPAGSNEAEEPAALPQTDPDAPAENTGSGGGSNNNSEQPGTSGGSGSGGSGGNGSGNGTGSSGGSGSGGNGSGGQNTDANTNTSTDSTGGGNQSPSAGNGGGSGTSQSGHTHTWKNVTEEKWVVDQAAWDEPIYEGRYVCSACGATFAPGTEISIHILDVHDGAASYSTTSIQTGTTHHDEVGHYETIVTGSVCTGCGATMSMP